MMDNILSRVIDELNNRMEEALDNDDYEKEEVLKNFYEWVIEEFVL